MARRLLSIVPSLWIALTLIAAPLLCGCGGPSNEPPAVSGGGGICVTTQFSLFVEGQSVLDAEQDDFEVYEQPAEANGSSAAVRAVQAVDGFQQRQICCFEPPGEVETQSAAVALVLDRSGSMDSGTRMADMQAAANLFVSLMRAQDVSEVVAFDDVIEVPQNWTSDQSLLTAAINALYPRGGTRAWDAADRGLTDVALRTEDVRAVVLMSDGDSFGDSVSLAQLIANAQAVGIPIFTIGFQAPSSAEANLRQLAQDTGGQFWALATAEDLIDAFGLISEGIQNIYTICWVSQIPRGEQGLVKIVYAPSDPDTEITKGFTVPLNGTL